MIILVFITIKQFNSLSNPIRFRIISEDGSNIVIKVEKVIYKDREKLAGNETIEFHCQSVIKEGHRLYEIKYELRTCKWILLKI